MQRRSRHAVWLLGLAVSSCTTPPEQAVGELGVQTEFVLLEDAPPLYPAFDPGDVTALDVLYVAEPTGDGYQHRPIRIGESLYFGKWLGIADGQGEFLGSKHIVVDHLRRRPKNPFMGDIEKSVLLDVETGEVVTEFARYGRPRYWGTGILIVYKEDDERPYLLDVGHPELVLAVPEGEHDYVYGKNFWVKLSKVDDELWIIARDQQGTPHLYQWEDRRRPPELPDNPFPFVPEDRWWEPGDGHDEIHAPDSIFCGRAILTPPKQWECVPDLEHTRAMSDGWRLDYSNNWVFNVDDGRGFDLSSLCPPEHPVDATVIQQTPPQVAIECEGDLSTWMVWSPPSRVQRLDPELAVRLNTAKLFRLYLHDTERFMLSENDPEGVWTKFDYEKMTWDLVGTDYFCDLEFRIGIPISGIGCRGANAHKLWFELIDVERKLRSRFSARELAVRNGMAVGIVRKGNRDHLVRLSL